MLGSPVAARCGEGCLRGRLAPAAWATALRRVRTPPLWAAWKLVPPPRSCLAPRLPGACLAGAAAAAWGGTPSIWLGARFTTAAMELGGGMP